MNKLCRSTNDRVLMGVCGGLAEFFSFPTILVRLLFILTSSVSVWIYLLLAWKLDERMTVVK